MFSEIEKLRFEGNVPVAVPDGEMIFIQESLVVAFQLIWQPSSDVMNVKPPLFGEDEKLTIGVKKTRSQSNTEAEALCVALLNCTAAAGLAPITKDDTWRESTPKIRSICAIDVSPAGAAKAWEVVVTIKIANMASIRQYLPTLLVREILNEVRGDIAREPTV